MGPHGVDRAPDYVREIEAMVASHPTLTYIRPRDDEGDGLHAATWDDDGGSRIVKFDYLPDLVAHLRPRFGAR